VVTHHRLPEPQSAAGPLSAPECRPLAEALVDAVPEFAPAYVDLVEACGDDPGEPLVLVELADFIADRLAAVETETDVLRRAAAAVEACVAGVDPSVSAFAPDDGGVLEMVAGAFFDSFSPEDRRRLLPWLGPGSRALLETLDAPGTMPSDR
jgi:hypothetical protein